MRTLKAVAFWVGLFLLGTAVIYLAYRERVLSADVAGTLWATFLFALVVQLGRTERRKPGVVEPKSVARIAGEVLLWLLVLALLLFVCVLLSWRLPN